MGYQAMLQRKEARKKAFEAMRRADHDIFGLQNSTMFDASLVYATLENMMAAMQAVMEYAEQVETLAETDFDHQE